MNAVAQSTLAGELTVIFSHQLLIAVDTEKGMRDKRMVSMPCDRPPGRGSVFSIHSKRERILLFM